MISGKLKSATPIDIISQIKNYIISNYDASSFTPSVEKFLGEVQQNRNVISDLGDVKQNLDSLKSNRQICMQYITQLNLLKSKMSFGKEKIAVHLNFTWKDTLKNSNCSSMNINFELYNVMFNLATIYLNIARIESVEAANDDSRLKEAIKSYQYAAGFFDRIKNEASQSIPEKEIPNDLKANYMTYCSCLCIAYAQKNLITVAENKKTSPNLLAQLCKGVEDMYKNAQLIAKEKPLCKLLGDQYLYYINNRVNYHEALTYSKLRDEALANFNKKGEGYGICITYQGALVQCLTNNDKEIKKIKVPLPKDTLILAKEQQNGSEMLDKNKVYRNPCPDLANLPKAMQKIMANPAIPPDYKDNVEDSRELDALIPREVRQMIEQYKGKMMDFIAQNLNQYENEDTVTQFLNSLGLPASLETVLSSSSISDSLWRNISEVQSRGGTMYLNNMMGTLQKMPGEIKNRIEQSSNLLKNEDSEDQKLRAQYGTKWNRRQSSDLNGNYIRTLEDYKGKLNQAMGCDQSTINDIQNNLKYFELLSLPRETLDQRIPHRIDPNSIKTCKEAEDLRKEMDLLEAEKNKAMEIISRIFASLNDDNVAAQFIQVIQKKTTENNILDQNKGQYMTMFNELGVVSNNIKNIKVNVQNKNEIFMRVRNDKFKPDPANEQFFRDLDNYVQLFRTKENQLQQGLNFYKKFDQKMNELNRNITDFLMARDLDKNELIRYISVGGGQGGGYQENKDYDQDRGFNGFWDFTKNAVNSVAGFIGNNIYNNKGNDSYNNNNRGGNQNKPPEVIPPSPQFNNNNQRGYGQNQGGYGQNQGGYNQNQGGYNQNQGGYNQGGYNQNQGGYNQGGYNQNQGGYGQNQGGYNQGGYNQNQGGYGQNQGGYGQNQGGYNQGGYNQNQGGYGQNQGGYNQGGYGQNQGGYNQGGYNQGGYGQNQGYGQQNNYQSSGYNPGSFYAQNK